MVKLIPAILEKDADAVLRKIELLKKTSLDTAHLDVMDNLAVSNYAWGVADVAQSFDVKIEVHLMVRHPLVEARKWLQLANVVRVIVRSEEIEDYAEYTRLARIDKKLGLAIDPTTTLTGNLLWSPYHNYILVMGVVSGYSGQKFFPATVGRVEFIKQKLPLLKIGVDGGMNAETIPLIKNANVDIINAASYFWDSDDFNEVINFVEG